MLMMYLVSSALKYIFPDYALVRSRNPEVIKQADIVLDVGGEYDPEAGRFDHHQRGGAGAREDGTPYSSFGLIWKKYGATICNDNQDIANSIDSSLVSSIDAIDCGYVKGVLTGVSLSQTISMFNPTWQEEGDFDGCFNQAVEFASCILGRFIASATGGISAKAIVAQAIENAQDPRIIVLEKYTPGKKRYIPYQRKLYMLFIHHNQANGKFRLCQWS
ncbi:MYG1 family protein [Psychromonas sp. KJ10-10]|uniref:MYG1 family protein n=1 Tax=Psychromonas sp. KJ10-10 TaxID=3391823 RepID=UPI0039B5CCAD